MPRPKTVARTTCPRCGKVELRVTSSYPVCEDCMDNIYALATEQQEREYLGRWLSTRLDESALDPYERRVARRLRRRADRMGVDYLNPVTTITTYGARVAKLLDPYRATPSKKGGRPAKRMALEQSTEFQEVALVR